MMLSSAASTSLSVIDLINNDNDESGTNDDNNNNNMNESNQNSVSINNSIKNNDEDPMRDFRLLTKTLVYGEVHKPSSSTESLSTNNKNRSNRSMKGSEKKRNNKGTAGIQEEEDEEIGVEVLPFKDMTRVRVELQSAFKGVPMPALVQQRTNSSKGRKTTSKTKIDSSHPQYELAVGMMLGIREAVSGMDELMQEAEWVEEDFCTDQLQKECRRNRKYTFFGKDSTTNAAAAAVGSETTASSASTNLNDTTKTKTKPKQREINFKAYAPLVFARLRAHLDKNLFLHSVCGNFRYLEFLSNAKSGSFFFFSHDGKYLIKTLTMSETHFLVHYLLPTYYHYLQQNPQSMLTRFYGLYRIQLSKGECIYFSIMQSVFSDAPPGLVDNISHTFDLKGSTLGRKAKTTDTVKKDLDILNQNRKLKVSAGVKRELEQQLRRDVTLLARLGIMDYSFLLGVHERAVDGEELLLQPQLSSPTQKQLLDHRKRFTSLKEMMEEEDMMSIKSDNISIASPHPYHEDEFIDWEQFEWLRPPCSDDCSVASSFEFLSDAASPNLAISPRTSLSKTASMQLLSKKHVCPLLASRTDGGIVSEDGQEIYFAGIIDILQPYNVQKWSETVYKQLQGNPHLSISCVDPETYAHRFIKFMSYLLEATDDNEEERQEEKKH